MPKNIGDKIFKALRKDHLYLESDKDRHSALDQFEAPVHSILIDKIKRDPARQRKDLGDIDELARSIYRHGLLQPIVVEPDPSDNTYWLIAGERRLEACKELERTEIEARIWIELSEYDRKVLEFEENFRRKQLSWQEECIALLTWHELKSESEPMWTRMNTADAFEITEATLNKRLNVARALRDGNERILACTTLVQAYGVLEREFQRQMDSEVADFIDSHDAQAQIVADPEVRMPSDEVVTPMQVKELERYEELQAGDFFELVEAYKGPKFHFIHLDPPYGISHDKSAQGRASVHGSYDDDPELYWKFLNQIFVTSRDKLLSSTSHVMFWFSMKYYVQTIEFLQEIKTKYDLKLKVFPFPLIWFKSDCIGIAPDPRRQPRRVYETALVVSFGDRKIALTIDNVASFPARKKEAQHLSEKPIKVMEHFFRMFIDSNTRVLDPCFGSGTSLIAAKRLGAHSIVGWELQDAYVEYAKTQMRRIEDMTTDELEAEILS